MISLRLLLFLNFLFSAAKAQQTSAKGFEFLDKNGVCIRMSENLSLEYPITEAFLRGNFYSNLIKEKVPPLTEFIIQEITETSKATYQVKVTYLYHAQDRKPSGFRNTIYSLRLGRVNHKYYIADLNYEEMEF